jgi:hypothetical protein
MRNGTVSFLGLGYVTMSPPSESVFFWSVVFVRFLVPLLIPKFPLPAILTCFVVDAVDQSMFEAFTHLDLTTYQAFDKALDVFYLSIAMLATMRNWVSYPAVQVAGFLFYFRLAGVVAFELTHSRPLLLLFPNTFEYFFIFYEIVRSRWSPARLSARYFIAAAAAIWVVIKLPQEYWIHVARLDLTDVLKGIVFGVGADVGWGEAIARQPAAFVLFVIVVLALTETVRRLVHRLVHAPMHSLAIAADALPIFIDEAKERDQSIAEEWRLFDVHLVEKIALVGCVTLIFAQILPGVDLGPLRLLTGVAIVVTLNSLIRLRVARAGRSRESALLSFVLLAAINIVFVALADWLLRREEAGLDVPATLFFLLLLTLIVTLYDRWHPVFDMRFMNRRRVWRSSTGARSKRRPR